MSITNRISSTPPAKRSNYTAANVADSSNVVRSAFKKWVFKQDMYQRYGLYYDDIREYDFCPEAKEAVRRLPSDLMNDRNYRLLRASQLDINKEYLPQDQWVTYEENQTAGRYLEPYVQEVLAEWKEKLDWEKKYN